MSESAGNSDDSKVAQAPQKRRVKRWLVAVGSLFALVVVIVIADMVTRAVVENSAAARIEESLPEHVHADVSAHLSGFSALWQLATGELDRITVTSTDATVDGIPLDDISIEATGVPTAAGKPIDSAAATATINESSLNKFLALTHVGGTLTLKTDAVGFRSRIDLLGFPIDYSATAKPRAEGDRIVLVPDAASLSNSAGALTLTPLVQALAAQGPISVCVAPYLPEGVRVTEIRVGSRTATVSLRVSHAVLNEKFWTSRGSCVSK